MHQASLLGPGPAQPARRLTWTRHADERFSQMALEGASIRALAMAFGVGRHAAHQRAQKLGVLNITPRHHSADAMRPKVAQELADLSRASLPAGHVLTWGVINLGTCLEGASYPAPDMAKLRRDPAAAALVVR